MEDVIKGTGGGESNGSESVSERIGWRQVDTEKVMDALKKMKGRKHIRIRWYCSGTTEIWR